MSTRKENNERILYYMEKEIARSSFVDWLEEIGLTEENYEEFKADLESNLGIDRKKTYLR